MLIFINTKEMIPLPQLFRLALKFIYDNKSIKYGDEARLKSSVVNWYDKIQEAKKRTADKYGIIPEMENIEIGKKGTPVDEAEYYLQIIGSLLKKNEEGKFEPQKALFREHGIDYRKYYRLPEAYSIQDFVKAKRALERNMKDRPGDYN